ncbi:hypothetical protein FBY35_6915 [Streptomyces sp. SLBN-118]|uniref:hypothetical protein n=1 Tax=Streptomyces sp. SLBN-118 TaxID=2768454 RepID=UPI0011543739|nr:hypothetical protein [Streptomyces sp. SLBN-118]TQK45354.1 hypothetical protein FBY35_6915 [Streptomyces sp. SLBN-118]
MRSTRTRNTRRMAVAAVATGLLAGGITAGTPDVFTTDKPTDMVSNAAAEQLHKQSRAKGQTCSTGALKIKNKKFVKTVYEWPDNPGAQDSIPGPGKRIFEYKIEISNKVSATFGMTYQQITAGLGFEVANTRTVTDRVEIELPEKAQYRVRAGMIYKQYTFDVFEERGFLNWYGDYLVCQSDLHPTWVKKGTATAQNPWMETYRRTKAPKRRAHQLPASTHRILEPTR